MNIEYTIYLSQKATLQRHLCITKSKKGQFEKCGEVSIEEKHTDKKRNIFYVK